MHPSVDRPIALVGLMGAGKSVVARILGDRLGRAVADLDAMIVSECGASVPELFDRSGEAAFRRLEGTFLARALASGAGVVACGGGVVLDPEHRTLLRESCRTVWLEVAPEEASRRVRRDGPSRPLLAGGEIEDRLNRLLAERRGLYEEVAEVAVSTMDRTPEEVAGAVLAALRETGP